MRLVKVQVNEFQSIRDSTEFKIGPVTCLVGKNEAGKTALLKALYRLHPINETDKTYNATHDYPRWSFVAYEGEVEAGTREPATVAQAKYELEPEDVAAIKEIYGPSCFADDAPSVTLRKGYSNQLEVSNLDINCQAALNQLIEAADLPQQVAGQLSQQSSPGEMVQRLSEVEQTESVRGLIPVLERIGEVGLSRYIFDEIIKERIPRFLYFDEYYQMKGQDNLEALLQRVKHNVLSNAA